jgi:hypothetical protein
MKKTRSRKSRDTVPLRQFKNFTKILGDIRLLCLSPMSTRPAISFSLVSKTPEIDVVGWTHFNPGFHWLPFSQASPAYCLATPARCQAPHDRCPASPAYCPAPPAQCTACSLSSYSCSLYSLSCLLSSYSCSLSNLSCSLSGPSTQSPASTAHCPDSLSCHSTVM